MTTSRQPYNQEDTYVAPATVEAAPPPTPSLEEAIRRTQSLLLSQQYPDGYWWAELDVNASITAQAVLLYKILAVDRDYPLHKMEAYLRRQLRRRRPRTPSSSAAATAYWELAHGDGGNLSISIEAYIALRLLGAPKSDPDLADSLPFILSRGGASASTIFTKLCLALLGCFDWRGIPTLPPCFMLFPPSFPTSIYEMSSCARASVVPLFVVFDKKPVFPVRIGSAATPTFANFDELFTQGSSRHANVLPSFSLAGNNGDWRAAFFVALDYTLKAMERVGFVPFRRRGLLAAEKWVLQHQEESGDWAGIFPAMFYSILCLHILGYPTSDPVMRRGLQAIAGFTVETAEVCRLQACISPVWDTALVVRSLVDSGIPSHHPALRHAAEWLLYKQILQPGDWSYKNPTNATGGWAFGFFNRWYPDVDDTSVVVMALDAVDLPNNTVKRGAMARAVAWIASMQCKAGGWGAFDKDNDQDWLNAMPFGDLKAMIDPNTADVTARVLEMAGRLGASGCKDNVGLLPAREVLERGMAYLRREQEAEGCWFGRWGVNYIYGTSGAMVALAALAGKEHEEEMGRAARWLVEVQNEEDGGWGETCFTYDIVAARAAGAGAGVRPVKKGRMEGDEESGSTASQTAWAIIGLLAAGEATGRYEMEAIERGVGFLLRTQRPDGSWHEPSFTGTGLPGHLYLRYHYYAQHFPLTALSRYRLVCLHHHHQQQQQSW